MTLRETLLAVRAIVADADPGPAKCGCLEDAICRVLTGKSWYEGERAGTLQTLHNRNDVIWPSPVYKALQAKAGVHHALWMWNDEHTKAQRIQLVDDAINAL